VETSPGINYVNVEPNRQLLYKYKSTFIAKFLAASSHICPGVDGQMPTTPRTASPDACQLMVNQLLGQ